MNIFDSHLAKRLIKLALEEDLLGGDVTSELTVTPEQKGEAIVVAREDLIFCGGPVIERIFREMRWSASISDLLKEGEEVPKGTQVVVIKGLAREILAVERTILNFLARMSGIATYTRSIIKKAEDLIVLDTRKTIPGWRVLDKYAVRVGGALNHRLNLSDLILVKNNHIALNGGSVKRALLRLFSTKRGFFLPIEVEVRSQKELGELLEFDIQAVMLDNMDDDEVREALEALRKHLPRVRVEVSGGMTLDRILNLKSLGVDCVSMGALTSMARNVDLAMRIAPI